VYRPSPSIPPGLQPGDWNSTVKAMQDEADRLARSLLAGDTVPKDIQTRALALQATMGRLSGGDAAQLGDGLFAKHLAPQLAGSYASLSDALVEHGELAAEDLRRWLADSGYRMTPNVGAIEAATRRGQQAMLHDWSRLTADTRANVVTAVQRGIVTGTNPREAARLLAQQVGEAGGIGYKRGLLIARTEFADVYDASRMATLDGLGDAVKGWRYRAQPDACPVCQVLHGLVFPKDQQPDRHHMCRCIIIPVLADDDVGVGEYEPGQQRPRSAVESQVPKAWLPLPDDLRTMLAKRDNPNWRPSWTMRKPGDGTRLTPVVPTPQPPKPGPVYRPDTIVGDSIDNGVLRVDYDDGYTAYYRRTKADGVEMSEDQVEWEPMLKPGDRGRTLITAFIRDRLDGAPVLKKPTPPPPPPPPPPPKPKPKPKPAPAPKPKPAPAPKIGTTPLFPTPPEIVKAGVDKDGTWIKVGQNHPGQYKIVGKWPDLVARLQATLLRAPIPDGPARQGANPGRSSTGPDREDYLVNCQRVVHATELRRRGYDVKARPNTREPSDQFGGGVPTDRRWTGNWGNVYSHSMWTDPRTGLPPMRMTGRLALTRAAKDWPVGARGTVSFSWKNGGAHIVNIEKRANGRLYITEAQVMNTTDKVWDQHLYSKLWDETSITVVRHDHCEPNWDVIAWLDVVEPA
jgi:hypothetical protein